MLGAFPHATYSAVELPFHEDTWAVLYTDGILEMSNSSEEEFGVDRLKLFLQESERLTADKFVDGLMDELSRWADRASGRETEDDLTLLAIHWSSPQECPVTQCPMGGLDRSRHAPIHGSLDFACEFRERERGLKNRDEAVRRREA